MGGRQVAKVHIRGQPVKQAEEFKYSSNVVQSSGDIDTVVTHRIRVAWVK